MSDSAFARAAASAAPAQNTAPAPDRLTGSEGYDPLLGGAPRPSLFTKEHVAGIERVGVITEVPFEKHSRFMDEDETGKPVSGALKFWDRTVQPNKPTDKPTDSTGKPNDPVMDFVIPLATEYRDRGERDDGSRAWFLGGKPALDAFRKASQDAGITSRPQLVGMTITVKRTGKSGRAWLYEAKLSR